MEDEPSQVSANHLNDYLPSEYLSAPLNALRISSRKKLALYLNLERLPNEDGIVPDFNGLAELVGFSYLEIQNFARDRSPTSVLLDEWSCRGDLNPTVGCLVKYLNDMRRDDVLTDCKARFLSDIEVYLKDKENGSKPCLPIQDDTVSQSIENTDHNVDETVTITTDDVESGKPTYYDAFVCYNPEGDDLKFVKTLIENLEGEEYKFKLFVPMRNDLPGSSRYVIEAKLIEERCRKFLIVLSPEYLQSPACDFQTKFAHGLSPGSRSKRLVPVLIKRCKIPRILQHISLCDYTKDDVKEWFWKRLASAVRMSVSPCKMISESSVSQIQLDLSSTSLASASDSLQSDMSSVFSSQSCHSSDQSSHTADQSCTSGHSMNLSSCSNVSNNCVNNSTAESSSLSSPSVQTSPLTGEQDVTASPKSRKKKRNALTKLFSSKH